MLSFWEREHWVHYDYIIAGAGILGLSIACEILEENNAKVLILERDTLPTGASTRNAGFACFGSLTEILSDIELNGEEKAIELVEKRWQGLSMLRSRLSDDKMGFLGHGGYELLDERQVPALEKLSYVNDLLRPIFKKDCFEQKNTCIAEFGFAKEKVKAVCYSSFEGQIDSGLMMRSLYERVLELGALVFQGTEIISFEEKNESVAVFTNSGSRRKEMCFTTDQLIIATNAEIDQLMPDQTVKPGRGQVLITSPISGLPFKGVFHYDEGFYYFRNFGERILFGGGRNMDFEGETTTKFEINDNIQARLEELLRTMIIPGKEFKVDMRWAGIMGFTDNKLPIIKKKSDHIAAAMTCNGMGVALASHTAKELMKQIRS